MKKFHDLLDQLIELQKENASSRIEYFNQLSKLGYFLEFGTVRCNIGRRTGKTEYIKRRAYFDDIVIVPNTFAGPCLYRNTGITCFTVDELLNCKEADFEVANVYIDEPSACFREKCRIDIYRKIIDTFNPTENTTFMLIGD